MLFKTTRMLKGVGIGLAIGTAAGALGYGCIYGMPSKRKLRRRLIHTADAVENTIENICCMMK